MNPVVHFEMPAEDRDRMAEFYSKAFGWEMQKLGPDMGNYVMVRTTETDENNMVKTPGAINGGFFQRTAENQHPSLVISVDDIDAAVGQVKQAGGKILGGAPNISEPVEIPGVGKYCSFLDTEGNRVSMLQPNKR